MSTSSDTDSLAGIRGLDRLVTESLDALGDADMAPRLLAHIAQALGSHKAVLFCPLPGLDPSDDAAAQAHQWGMPEDFLVRYAELIQVRDAWSDALARQQTQALARGGSLSQQLIATRELRRTAFFADYLRPLGIDAMVNSVVEASPEHGMHVLALYNEQGRGEFTPARFAQLRAATPWVRSLMRAQRRMRQARQQAQALERGLDQLALGLVQVNARGALRLANAWARDWLGLADECRGLLASVRGGSAPPPVFLAQVQPALAALVPACLLAGTPLPARLRSAQGRPLLALATPLRGQGANRAHPRRRAAGARAGARMRRALWPDAGRGGVAAAAAARPGAQGDGAGARRQAAHRAHPAGQPVRQDRRPWPGGFGAARIARGLPGVGLMRGTAPGPSHPPFFRRPPQAAHPKAYWR